MADVAAPITVHAVISQTHPTTGDTEVASRIAVHTRPTTTSSAPVIITRRSDIRPRSLGIANATSIDPPPYAANAMATPALTPPPSSDRT